MPNFDLSAPQLKFIKMRALKLKDRISACTYLQAFTVIIIIL
jgi:hypothetical protein